VDADQRKPVAAAHRLFGTDGIRGVANAEPMTPDTVLRVGVAVGQVCKLQTARPTVVVGRDTRRSGEMLEGALAAGLASTGVDVILAGIIPTPAVAMLTRTLPATAGAMVSASHNPFADNGVKFFATSGFKFDDEVEGQIEELVVDGGAAVARPTGGNVGRVTRLADALDRYRTFLRHATPGGLSLRGVKIVLDCAHGAAYQVAPEVFTALGADVVALGVTPDGENINDASGAVHPEQLQATVVAERAQLGLALDGDADRAILVDEKGTLVDGDEVLAMLGVAMLESSTLKHRTVVATVMSNLGLEICLRERGARLIRTAVGDRHVVEEMVRHGYNLGGEQSGHLLFLDRTTTGDGLLAGLQAIGHMMERQRPLSELKTVMSKYPQVLLNVRMKERREVDRMPTVRQAIDRVAGELGERGRILVRYSGTEPLLRIMVEGEALERVRAYAEDIAAVVRAAGGAE
jgi:phosphoglucosamine mutase